MISERITIIILAYKSKHIIDDCLADIKEAKNIVVVDNASNDDIKSHIEKKYPNIKFIGLDKNIGFGRANNIALRDVRTDYALVLNPDAKISPDAINNIINVMDSLPKAALGSPVIFNKKKEKLKYKLLKKIIPWCNSSVEERKRSRKLSALIRRSKKLQAENVTNDNVIFTDFICGCGMFFKMSLMKNVGFFDENIFMYHEDSIISKNVIDKNYENVIVKDSVLYHICNGSSEEGNKPANERLNYFKNWQIGWSEFYFMSASLYKNDKKICALKQKEKLLKLKYKLFINKLLKKDTISIQAKIDGGMDYLKGADPFMKTI